MKNNKWIGIVLIAIVLLLSIGYVMKEKKSHPHTPVKGFLTVSEKEAKTYEEHDFPTTIPFQYELKESVDIKGKELKLVYRDFEGQESSFLFIGRKKGEPLTYQTGTAKGEMIPAMAMMYMKPLFTFEKQKGEFSVYFEDAEQYKDFTDSLYDPKSWKEIHTYIENLKKSPK